ncbi:MAG TPA: YihY/virulence factor BrkB family protein [Acidimicrobiales bacterium]
MLRRVLAPFIKKWRWAETAVRVQERFSEVHGGYLATAITFAAFTSLFPLLLFATAVVGWLSFRDVDVAAKVIGELGLGADSAAATAITKAIATAEKSRRIAGPLGAIGLLWSGLGLVAAVQYAFDNVWQVKGRGIKDKLHGLAWLAGSAVLFAVSFALTAALNYAPFAAPLTIVGGFVVGVFLWLWTMRTLTNVPGSWKAHLPGAIVGAIGFEVLKAVGSVYVPRAVGSSSALYGSLGVVFAILAWLFFFGRLSVYAAVLNVVRWEEDHGTVTVEIEMPRHADVVPVEATRAGEAKDPVVSTSTPATA